MDNSDSEDDVLYSEKWIRKRLNWNKKGNTKGNNIDNNISKSGVTKKSLNEDDIVNLSDSIEISSSDEKEFEEDVKVSFIEESRKIFRFSVHTTQMLETLFVDIAKFKNLPVSYLKLVMMPDEREVSQYDTLRSLNYSVTNFFYAYFNSKNLSNIYNNGCGNIEIVCTTPDKKKLLYKMDENQPFDILMSYCSRELKLNRNQFHLLFDGEIIKPQDTCTTLDVGNHDLIEIHFCSV